MSALSPRPVLPIALSVALPIGLAVALVGPDVSAGETSPTTEHVVARTPVPRPPEQSVGEVRLIQRPGADVVETLLYTKILERVIGEIRKKELANWGDDVPGHRDAERYLDMLVAAQKTIWERIPKDRTLRDRRQKMWIDFVLSPRESRVSVGSFEMDESGGDVRVVTRETLAEADLSRSYVRRNMRLIAADSFGVEGPALEALLEPLHGLRAAEPTDF